MKHILRKILLTTAISAAIPATHGALAVTNGSFGTANQNGGIVDGGGWFESGTANWVEGSWLNVGIPTVFTSGPMLLFDGGGTVGYLYQSLGTLTASDIATGNFSILASFGKKVDGWTNTAVFDVYAGSFTGANGTDISSGGLVSLASFSMAAIAQGLTAEYGNIGRTDGVAIGSFDVSGQAVGTPIWLRIGESRIANPGGTGTAPPNGDLLIDNVAVIPEPSTALLGGLGVLALLRRRR